MRRATDWCTCRSTRPRTRMRSRHRPSVDFFAFVEYRTCWSGQPVEFTEEPRSPSAVDRPADPVPSTGRAAGWPLTNARSTPTRSAASLGPGPPDGKAISLWRSARTHRPCLPGGERGLGRHLRTPTRSAATSMCYQPAVVVKGAGYPRVRRDRSSIRPVCDDQVLTVNPTGDDTTPVRPRDVVGDARRRQIAGRPRRPLHLTSW